MRRALALVPSLIIALAPPAAAQVKGRLSVPPPVLRSAPAPEPEPETVLVAPLLSPLPPARRADAEARQCRLSCAQDYYQCQGGDLSEDCGAQWGQCRVRCGSGDGA